MSLSAAAIRKMADKGLSIEDIAEIAEAIEEGFARPVPAYDLAKATKRARDAERMRRKREEEKGDGRRDGRATPSDRDAPAHVRDIPPRLVTTGGSSAADCVSDWPEDQPGGLAKRLASLAGPGLADIAKAPGLTTTAGEIVRWRQMGCSWSLDVVPVIQGRTAKQRHNPVGSWSILTNDVLAAKARRERPIDAPREATGPPGGSIVDRIGAEQAESRRRAFEIMDRKNG